MGGFDLVDENVVGIFSRLDIFVESVVHSFLVEGEQEGIINEAGDFFRDSETLFSTAVSKGIVKGFGYKCFWKENNLRVVFGPILPIQGINVLLPGVAASSDMWSDLAVSGLKHIG